MHISTSRVQLAVRPNSMVELLKRFPSCTKADVTDLSGGSVDLTVFAFSRWYSLLSPRHAHNHENRIASKSVFDNCSDSE